jgi:hypothetical protein
LQSIQRIVDVANLVNVGNGDVSKVERKPVQLVVLIQESKAKEERERGGNEQLADGLI